MWSSAVCKTKSPSDVASNTHPLPMPSTSWWMRLADMHIVPFSQDWSHSCSFYHINLISGEGDGWCCNRGRTLLPQLPPCDAFLESLQSIVDIILLIAYGGSSLPSIASFCMMKPVDWNEARSWPFLNMLLYMIETVVGKRTLRVEGRVYHRLLDVLDHNGRSMHWFLYEAGRLERGKKLAIPERAIS